jgi:hypothetical protein
MPIEANHSNSPFTTVYSALATGTKFVANTANNLAWSSSNAISAIAIGTLLIDSAAYLANHLTDLKLPTHISSVCKDLTLRTTLQNIELLALNRQSPDDLEKYCQSSAEQANTSFFSQAAVALPLAIVGSYAIHKVFQKIHSFINEKPVSLDTSDSNNKKSFEFPRLTIEEIRLCFSPSEMELHHATDSDAETENTRWSGLSNKENNSLSSKSSMDLSETSSLSSSDSIENSLFETFPPELLEKFITEYSEGLAVLLYLFARADSLSFPADGADRFVRSVRSPLLD